MNDAQLQGKRPPMPMEWHPWYRDKTWLYDWLLGHSSYPAHEIRLAIQPVLRAHMAESSEVDLEGPGFRYVTLTKNRAVGAAPYVGRPFCYVWTVATDELGRGIATDSEIHYLKPWDRPLESYRP